LAGCDVGCVWCDVKESWDAGAHKEVDIQEIISAASESKSRIVVVTGGEPLMYNLDLLTEQLKKNRLNTHIETSGAYPLSGEWDWICLSPKKFKKPVTEAFDRADELKVIVYNKHDFNWAEEYGQQSEAGLQTFSSARMVQIKGDAAANHLLCKKQSALGNFVAAS
jgi:7-carboxy-7-deazaguanine synthase